MKRKPRRCSIQLKLNALVIGSILAVALGLTLISYYVFCQRVDNEYYSSLERASKACASNFSPEVIHAAKCFSCISGSRRFRPVCQYDPGKGSRRRFL